MRPEEGAVAMRRKFQFERVRGEAEAELTSEIGQRRAQSIAEHRLERANRTGRLRNPFGGIDPVGAVDLSLVDEGGRKCVTIGEHMVEQGAMSIIRQELLPLRDGRKRAEGRGHKHFLTWRGRFCKVPIG